MDNSIYLFAAFGVTWSVIFIYIYWLYRGQTALSRQLNEISKSLQENIDSNASEV